MTLVKLCVSIISTGQFKSYRYIHIGHWSSCHAPLRKLVYNRDPREESKERCYGLKVYFPLIHMLKP